MNGAFFRKCAEAQCEQRTSPAYSASIRTGPIASRENLTVGEGVAQGGLMGERID